MFLPQSPLKRALVGASLIAGISGILHVLAAWWSVAPRGSDLAYAHITWTFMVILFLTVVANYLYVLFSAIAKLFRLRKTTWEQLGINFLFFTIVFIVCSVAIAMGLEIRQHAYKDIVHRGKPVIAALEKFQTKEGHPPSDLDALVPDYLARVPDTGVGAYPDYELITNSSPLRYGGNRWILSVDVSTESLEHEALVYYPNHQYPKPPEVISTYRYGEWALIAIPKKSSE